LFAFHFNNMNKSKGFSLIETCLYISIISFVFVSLIALTVEASSFTIHLHEEAVALSNILFIVSVIEEALLEYPIVKLPLKGETASILRLDNGSGHSAEVTMIGSDVSISKKDKIYKIKAGIEGIHFDRLSSHCSCITARMLIGDRQYFFLLPI
jgi:type II secretory pathway pseudopilin PulG